METFMRTFGFNFFNRLGKLIVHIEIYPIDFRVSRHGSFGKEKCERRLRLIRAFRFFHVVFCLEKFESKNEPFFFSWRPFI